MRFAQLSFKRKLKKALDYLKHFDNPVANTTVALVENKKVNVCPLQNIQEKHFEYIRTFVQQSENIETPNVYPPDVQFVKAILTHLKDFKIKILVI